MLGAPEKARNVVQSRRLLSAVEITCDVAVAALIFCLILLFPLSFPHLLILLSLPFHTPSAAILFQTPFYSPLICIGYSIYYLIMFP
jgi:ABC-type sulfate transport system permease component